MKYCKKYKLNLVKKMRTIYNKQINKGKKMVLLIIAINNLYYSINIFLSLNIQNTQLLLKQIILIATLVIISLLFYKGFNAGAWFSVTFLIQPVMTIVFYSLDIIDVLELHGGLVFLIIAVLVCIIGVNIIVNQNCISEFMKYQRDKRRLIN